MRFILDINKLNVFLPTNNGSKMYLFTIMENFILGAGVTILFFSLIHLTEQINVGNKENLSDDEKKWLEGK